MKKQYDLVFITTFVNKEHIETLMASIINTNKSLNVLLLIICQNGHSILKHTTEYISTIYILLSNMVGLSKARNIGLNYLYKHNIDYKYIMFPDDDSIFDESFFINFATYIRGNTLIAVKASQDRQSYFIKMPNKQLASFKDYKYAISVNMIVRKKCILEVGGFDEELGVGAYYGAGEDNDFFIRCNNIESFTFCNNIWNYHPLQKENISLPLEKLISRYKSYGRGVISMLVKHHMYNAAITTIIRGYLGSLINLFHLRPQMSYVYFVAANTRLVTLFKRSLASH